MVVFFSLTLFFFSINPSNVQLALIPTISTFPSLSHTAAKKRKSLQYSFHGAFFFLILLTGNVKRLWNSFPAFFSLSPIEIHTLQTQRNRFRCATVTAASHRLTFVLILLLFVSHTLQIISLRVVLCVSCFFFLFSP